MTAEEIQALARTIEGPDRDIMLRIARRWDRIAKPLDSLGEFEKIIGRIGGITRQEEVRIDRRAVLVLCADNGIVEEHVSQSTQEVTALVARNMTKGISSIGRMAVRAHADVLPVDIGINIQETIPGLIQKRIAPGTRNFLREPAMSLEEAAQAISTGIELVEDCVKKGYQILATGEMGIGNTTTSSAVAAALLGCPAGKLVGAGAGLSLEGVSRKCSVVEAALEKYALRKEETMRILATVGGFDLAGLVGIFLGGARYHVPVILDGIVSTVAALAAGRLAPCCREYMIASHLSREPAAAACLQELRLRPVLDANLALGEGTGAAMLFPLLDMALCVYHESTTFQEIALEQYQRFEGSAHSGSNCRP